MPGIEATMSLQLAQSLVDPTPQFKVPTPREKAARIIRSGSEAIAVAQEVAAILAEGAAERDRERRLPDPEMDILSDAGLLAITVPKDFGGAGVTAGTLAEVIAIIAAA